MFKYYATLDFISNQESSIIHNGKLNKYLYSLCRWLIVIRKLERISIWIMTMSDHAQQNPLNPFFWINIKILTFIFIIKFSEWQTIEIEQVF